MILTPRGLLEHSRTEAGRRMIRYAATSGIGVIGTQIFLVLFLVVLGMEPVPSNLSATMLMSVPSFLLNKHWVWGKSGKAHMRREVIPFWVFTVAGWGLSTAAVYVVARAVPDDSVWHTPAVMSATIAGFGILWVLKYVFLDKIMFGPDHHTPYDVEFEIEEAQLEEAELGTHAAGVPET